MANDEISWSDAIQQLDKERQPAAPVFHSLVPNAELETLMEIKRAAMAWARSLSVHQIKRLGETEYALWDACCRAKEGQ